MVRGKDPEHNLRLHCRPAISSTHPSPRFTDTKKAGGGGSEEFLILVLVCIIIVN